MSEENGKTAVKGDPIPTRFDAPEDELIRALHKDTGLSMAEIVRRANRFALPRFKTGEIDILTLKPREQFELPLAAGRSNGR